MTRERLDTTVRDVDFWPLAALHIVVTAPELMSALGRS